MPLVVQHFDREPAETIDGGKSVLVGGVIAGIDRSPTGKGRLLEKGGDGRALVADAWLELGDLAPKDDTELRLFRGQAAGKPRHARAIDRRQSIVERQAA